MWVDSIDQSITLSRPTTRRNSSARAASGADADDEAAAEDDAADADMTGRPRARQVPAIVARAEKPSVSRVPRGTIHVSRQNKQEAHTYAHAYGRTCGVDEGAAAAERRTQDSEEQEDEDCGPRADPTAHVALGSPLCVCGGWMRSSRGEYPCWAGGTRRSSALMMMMEGPIYTLIVDDDDSCPRPDPRHLHDSDLTQAHTYTHIHPNAGAAARLGPSIDARAAHDDGDSPTDAVLERNGIMGRIGRQQAPSTSRRLT